MKWIVPIAVLGAMLSIAPAEAGCIKGALVGGVAGHFAHHGLLGAAAGCAYGVHRSHQQQRMQMQQDDSVQGQPQTPPSNM